MLEESGQGNKYEATIVGHRGTVILRLGAGRSKDVPEGYELAADGDIYKPYAIINEHTFAAAEDELRK